MCALSLSPFIVLDVIRQRVSLQKSSASKCRWFEWVCVNGAGGLVGDAACRLLKAQQEIQKELACWNLSANFLSALNNQPPLYIFT